MRDTGSLIDIGYPLGTLGLLLLLVVARLAGPAFSPHTTTRGRAGGFAARRALDIVAIIGWLFDRFPHRVTAAAGGAETGHGARVASRTTAAI